MASRSRRRRRQKPTTTTRRSIWTRAVRRTSQRTSRRLPRQRARMRQPESRREREQATAAPLRRPSSLFLAAACPSPAPPTILAPRHARASARAAYSSVDRTAIGGVCSARGGAARAARRGGRLAQAARLGTRQRELGGVPRDGGRARDAAGRRGARGAARAPARAPGRRRLGRDRLRQDHTGKQGCASGAKGGAPRTRAAAAAAAAGPFQRDAVEAQMRRVLLARRCRSFCSTIASNAWRAARARSSARSLGAHRRRSRLLAANGNPPLVFTSRGSWPRRPSELRPSADCSRLSAISVAERVAAERVEPIGRTVGYQVSTRRACRMHAAQPSLPHDTARSAAQACGDPLRAALQRNEPRFARAWPRRDQRRQRAPVRGWGQGSAGKGEKRQYPWGMERRVRVLGLGYG
jgi:hypothetical protein